jgi:L-Ala-D/L-Glu epimerase
MQLHFQTYDLQLRYPFRIAIYSRTSTPIVLTTIEHAGRIGRGEASLPPYLGESHASVSDFLRKVKNSKILKNLNPETLDIQEVMQQVDALVAGNTAAKAAVDIALHDLKAQFSGQPVWQYLGSDLGKMPVTSCTIGIENDLAILEQKIKDAADFVVLKIKLGSEDDYAFIRQIRQFTDKPLYADANQGWKEVNQALDVIHFLKENGVILVEQPMVKTDIDANAKITEGSPLPIFADESFQRFADFDKISGAFHGINIKLMKSTGLSEAKMMVEEARRRQLKIMIGCMSETNCAILAAAALAPQCDFADLDGPWLIANNPFEPPILRGGKIQLTDAFGLGLI